MRRAVNDWTRQLRAHLRLDPGEMSVLGSERSFGMPIGENWEVGGELDGYYIDFRRKCESPEWPPYWLQMRADFAIAVVQWGLGALEHYSAGAGEVWLKAARGAGEHLLGQQRTEGFQQGGWQHPVSMPHSYRIDPPWISGITQGEAASLLVRLHLITGEDRYAEAAKLALQPMRVPASDGGTLAFLDGDPLIEEYPTDVPSWVLNGSIFAIWGFRDIGVGLKDSEALNDYDKLANSLASNLWRFDTGHWSRYDLYPHPVANLATPAYHGLHIKQLQVMNSLHPRTEFGEAAGTFERYRSSRSNRARALGSKVLFRLLVPRNRLLAHRMPWSSRTSKGRRRSSDTVVLSYHAVSPTWSAPLSVTPENLSVQLRALKRMGYQGVTFGEAVRGDRPGKTVAITFDDAYRSVFELARPILEECGMPGTVFVPTDFIDRGAPMAWPGIDHWLSTPDEAELVPMSWEQARALADAGWEIGSHTKSHPRLSQLDAVRLQDELAGSRSKCERMIERPCVSLAYPYGDHDDAVVTATADAGYSMAATLPAGYPEPLPLRWPRVGIYHHDSKLTFRLKISPAVRRLRRSPLWATAMRVVRRSSGRTVE